MISDEGATRLMESICEDAKDEFTGALRGYKWAAAKIPSAREKLDKACEKYVKAQDKLTELSIRYETVQKKYIEAFNAWAEHRTAENTESVEAKKRMLARAEYNLKNFGKTITEAKDNVDAAIEGFLRVREQIEKNIDTIKKEAKFFRGEMFIDPGLLGVDGDTVINYLIKKYMREAEDGADSKEE